MTTSYEYAEALAAELDAAGIRATTKESAAVPPCVLITMPARRYDLNCGYTATFDLIAMVNGPADEDAWKDLDNLIDAVSEVVDVTEVQVIGYGKDTLPAAFITVEGIIE